MTWVRVEPRARLHPKFFRVGVAAWGLDVAAWGYCNEHLTDGFVPTSDLGLVFPGTPLTTVRRLVDKLVAVGRWTVVENGWQIHDFHDFQPSAEDEIMKMDSWHTQRVNAGRSRAASAGRAAGRFTSETTSESAGDVAGSPLAAGTSEPTSERTSSVSVSVSDTEKKNSISVLTDAQFIDRLKTNPAYQGIDIDTEMGRMEAWLSTRPGRKRTRRFIVNWLNRVDRPVSGAALSAPKSPTGKIDWAKIPPSPIARPGTGRR